MSQIFKGLYTAIITPFKDNKIDFNGLEKLLLKQLNCKVDGIVVAGSTGEIHALSNDEYSELISNTVKLVAGKAKVIAGVGYNTTDKTIEMAKIAEKFHIDGIMAVTPYYNKPTQEGLFRHYKELHNLTNSPIIVYSVPGRTGIDISDNLMLRLADLHKIVAFKDAAGDIEKPLRLKSQLKDRFSLFCGDDSWAVAYNANGGVGCISVASNVIPAELKQIQDYTLANNFKDALNEHIKYIDLFKVLFVESNPIPVKYALNLMGFCNEDLRLPLCELSNNNKPLVKSALEKLGLI